MSPPSMSLNLRSYCGSNFNIRTIKLPYVLFMRVGLYNSVLELIYLFEMGGVL